MNKKFVAGLLSLGVLALIAGSAWFLARGESKPIAATVVSQNGLHWHAELSVREGGVEVPIPADLGLGAVHNPIHTHDEPGIIHMEFSGRVTEDDLRISNFFRTWGRELPATAVMMVNGEPKSELGGYIMRDGDKIKLSY